MKPFIRNHPRGFRKSFWSRIKRQFPKINKDTSKESKYVVKQKHAGKNLINDKHHKEEITIGLPESL
jgi:hypothetical protein